MNSIGESNLLVKKTINKQISSNCEPKQNVLRERSPCVKENLHKMRRNSYEMARLVNISLQLIEFISLQFVGKLN